MYGSPFGYGGGLGLGVDPYGFGQQNPYGQNFGQQNPYGGFGIGQNNYGQGSFPGAGPINTGNSTVDLLLTLGRVLEQVGNIAINAAYARGAGRGAFPYSSPYQFAGAGFGGAGFGATGFGRQPVFGQPGIVG